MDTNKFRLMVNDARERIKYHIHKTPLEVSTRLSHKTGTQVYLKLENEQATGSFKVRGAMNVLSLLRASGNYQPGNPPITASTGNHALACEFGAIFISPYNDMQVMAGQGTVGLEILEQLPDVDAIFASVGGGGLIGGIAGYVKAINPNIKIIGCQPKNSKVMYESVKAGKIVEESSYDTLSDGTAGGIEDNTVTLYFNMKYVDSWVLVEEDEISRGVYYVLRNHHKVIEGSAGVVIGAFCKVAAQYKGQKVVLVMCGANISMENLQLVLKQNVQSQEAQA